MSYVYDVPNSSSLPIDGVRFLLSMQVIAEYISLISAGIQILNLENKFSDMMFLFRSFFKVIEAMVAHYEDTKPWKRSNC